MATDRTGPAGTMVRAAAPSGLGLLELVDAEMMNVTADYRVTVRDERLSYPADPANRVLLDFHGKPIRLPREDSLWPDRERLE